jgi:hypothetical protein
MTGTSHLADLGKMAQEERVQARHGFLYKMKGKRLVHVQGSLMGVELGWNLSWSTGNFAKGWGCYWEWLHFPRGET